MKPPWEMYAGSRQTGETAQRAPFDPARQQPAAQPQQAPQEQQPQPWQQYSDPAAQQAPGAEIVGDSGSYDTAMDSPPEVNTKMSPADEAIFKTLAMHGSADDIIAFQASRGFQSAPGAIEQFVKDRDHAVKTGGKVSDQITYSFPDMTQIDQSRVGGAGGAMTRGALDTITLGLAPKAGAAARAFQDGGNGRSFSDNYNYERDLGIGVRQQDSAEHPIAQIAGQLEGGLILPAGIEGVGVRAGTEALRGGATLQEARTIAAQAVRNRLMQVGGGYGAAHGALSADDPAHALTGALTEGSIGALTSGALGQVGVGRANAPRVPAPVATDAQQLMAAADRQGIDVLPADVGGPMTRRMTAGLAQTPFGVGPIVAATERMGNQAQGVRDQVAAQIGQILRPEAAGQTAIRGAQSFIARTGTRANQLYRAAEAEANGASVTPTMALQALDRNIAELAQVPGGADGLARLQGLREALAAGDVTVTGMRGMRTALRDGFTSDGLRGSDIERRVNQVIDASTQDVTNGLNAQGRGQAARLYTLADRYYRQRVDTIDNVIEPLISGKSGEQVIKTLTSDLQGNNARAVRFIRSLPPEEQGDVRASIIGAMGRATKGTQNADGTAFSLPTFLTHWNEIGDTAKRAYFGPEARAALDDLARVANGTKLAQRYANSSSSAGAMEAGRLLTYITALPSLGGSVVGQIGLGRMLASPRFARWLARAPRTQLAPTAYIDRLSRIARAEPAIANEVLQLQQRLADVFSGGGSRMAAQPSAPATGAVNEGPDGVGEAQGNQGSDQNAQPDGQQP